MDLPVLNAVCRAYSIASPAFVEDFLELHSALVPTGTLWQRLFGLEICDWIWLSRKSRRSLYVATVNNGRPLC